MRLSSPVRQVKRAGRTSCSLRFLAGHGCLLIEGERDEAFQANGPSRCRRDDGLALAGIVELAGRDAGAVSQALRRALHGQRHQRESLVGQGLGRRDEVEQVAGAARAAEEEDQRDQRPVQPAGRRHGLSPRTDRQPAIGRADSEGSHRQVGADDGPGPREPSGPGDAAARHRARMRAADDRVSRDELLAGVQLAHLVADRGLTHAQRGVPVARLRQPVREPRQPAVSEHSRPRHGSRGESEPGGQLYRQSQAG